MILEQNTTKYIFPIFSWFWWFFRSGLWGWCGNSFLSSFVVQIFRHQTKKWAETIVRVVGFASNFQEMFIPWVLRFPKVSASSDKFCSQGASKTSKNPGRFPAWCRKIATLVSKNQKWDLFLAKPPTLKCCNSNVRRSYVINLDISNNRICSSLILAQE